MQNAECAAAGIRASGHQGTEGRPTLLLLQNCLALHLASPRLASFLASRNCLGPDSIVAVAVVFLAFHCWFRWQVRITAEQLPPVVFFHACKTGTDWRKRLHDGGWEACQFRGHLHKNRSNPGVAHTTSHTDLGHLLGAYPLRKVLYIGKVAKVGKAIPCLGYLTCTFATHSNPRPRPQTPSWTGHPPIHPSIFLDAASVHVPGPHPANAPYMRQHPIFHFH